MRKLKIAFTIVAIITILGFIFRIAGINFGLPQVFHPDEPFIVERANTMALTGDMNPHFFIYPSLLIYIYCLLFKIEHILLDEVTRSIIYVTARSFNALLGALMVPLTYMLGSKLYSKKIGILSSAFMAFAPIAVENSHYATVDIPLTFFILLAFLSIVRIIGEGSKRSYILSGCLIGLASSVKYTAGLLIIPLLTAFIIRCKISSFNWIEIKKLLLAYVTALVSFLITTPYSIFDFNNFKEDLLYISGHVRGTHGVLFKEEPSGFIYHIQTSLSSGLTVYIEVLSIIAIAYIIIESILRRSERISSNLILLSWILPYYFVIGSWGNLFPRYVIPLLPFLLITVAYLLHRLSLFTHILLRSRIQLAQESFANAFLLIFTLALLINPITASLKIDQSFLKNDTRQTSLEWIDKNIPENSIIFREYYTPEVELLGKYLVNNFDIKLADISKENIIEADYLIISSGVYDRYYRKPEVSRKEIAFYEYLNKNLQLLKEFKPDKSTKGPTIKIYLNGELKDSPLLNSYEIGNYSNFYVSKGLIEIADDSISLQGKGFVGWKYFLRGDERFINIIHKENNIFGLLIATKKEGGGFMNTQSWIISDVRKVKPLNLEEGWVKTSIPLPATLKGIVKIKIFKQDDKRLAIIRSIGFE